MELNLRTTMRIRGMVKLISIAILVNQVLTFLFAYVTDRLDPGAPIFIRSVFSFATCWLISSWLQTDARQAYMLAQDKGFVTPIDDTHPALYVSTECPKRWLVVLHIEMHPAVVGL